MSFAIRELVAPEDGLTVAATLGSGAVQVWDLSTLTLRTEIKTVYRFIGSRSVELASGGPLIAADSLGGVMAAYSIVGGRVLWRRKLPNPDRLLLGALPGHFWYSTGVGKKRPAVECAECETGRVTQTIKDAKKRFEGHHGASLTEMWKETSPYILRKYRRMIEIPRMSFGLLSAAFSADCLFLSEAGGPVRCLSSSSGEMRWIFRPEADTHFLKLYYNVSDDFTYGVWHRYEHAQFRRLVRFEPATGKMEAVCNLECSSECFVQCRQQIVTSGGSIIELASGRSVGSLEFPTNVYPEAP